MHPAQRERLHPAAGPGEQLHGLAYGAPREEAWLAAFGLTLTLVWIYLEFLRLIAIFSSSD
ncbi:hypothetical protein SHIRM173S_03578 [Streptomyces hirsutus]